MPTDPNTLLHQTTVNRVRWLIEASDTDASALCGHAELTDSVPIHCARMALHLVRGIPLPGGYAWGVLQAPDYQCGLNNYTHPLEGHLLTMALLAADLPMNADLATYCGWKNRELQAAAVRRFTDAPRVLSDERIAQLARDERRDVRAAVARVLERRKTAERRELLERMFDDPDRIVQSAAVSAAASCRDPRLADALVARGWLRGLAFKGDPRARACVEALVENEEDPVEEAVPMAARLGDRDLIDRLLRRPVWQSRMNMIRRAVGARLFTAEELVTILQREQPEHLLELAVTWPAAARDWMVHVARGVCAPIGALPPYDKLAAGDSAAVDQVQAWMRERPLLSGAALRMMPEHLAVRLADEMATLPDIKARRVAVKVMRWSDWPTCDARLAELCLDTDEEVAHDGIAACGWRTQGLYALDTLIVRSGDDFEAGIRARTELGFRLCR